jgi:hypothetical protein
MMSPMQTILGQWLFSLKQYISMSLFLSSPERLPCNRYCTGLTILTYYLLCLGLVDEERGFAELAAHLTLELGLLALFVYTGLRWKKSMARFQQTFSALVGVNMIVTLASILLYRIDTGYENPLENPLFYLLLLWNLAVMSLIFKRALDIPVHLSAMIAFNYYVVYQFILIWFYW